MLNQTNDATDVSTAQPMMQPMYAQPMMQPMFGKPMNGTSSTNFESVTPLSVPSVTSSFTMPPLVATKMAARERESFRKQRQRNNRRQSNRARVVVNSSTN